MDTTTTEDESADDDEVIREFDVYLSKGLSNQLYLLQYPVLSAKREYGPHDREMTKIKSQNNKIEMDVSLDTSSANYDQSKGEQIALNVDGNAAPMQAPTMFETNIMDRQTLYSNSVPSTGKRYACGVFQNGDVHLTPISHTLQMRPSFKYMDRAEHRASLASKARAATEDSSQDEAEDAKAVTVRIKGAETEAARLARERSYAAYEKSVADEKWLQMRMYHKTDNYSERESQRLLCQNTRQCGDKMNQVVPAFSEMVQTPSEYLTKLVPVYSEHVVDNTSIPSNVLSLSLLKNETLGEQLKLLMKNAKIIHFSHLLSLLHDPPDANAIVRSLQSYAVLVKGCWIVKSNVLFPPETVSPITGTPAESLCRSRDYILYMFTKEEYLVRKEVTSTVKIPGDDVKAILEDIAVMRIGLGWKLRLTPDTDFEKKFPEVCERQIMLWNALGTKLAKQMNLTDITKDMGTISIKQEGKSSPRKKKGAPEPSDQKGVGVMSPKASAKRQRKYSGHKSRVNAALPSASPQMEKKVQPLSLTNSESPSRTKKPNRPANPGHLAYSQTISAQPFVNLNSGELNSQVANNVDLRSPGINIDGVNSTVQSVANEMIKMGSSNQAVPCFTPQRNTAFPNSVEKPPARFDDKQSESEKHISKINNTCDV